MNILYNVIVPESFMFIFFYVICNHVIIIYDVTLNPNSKYKIRK